MVVVINRGRGGLGPRGGKKNNDSSKAIALLNLVIGGLRWWELLRWAVQERAQTVLGVVAEELGGEVVIIEWENYRGGVIVPTLSPHGLNSSELLTMLNPVSGGLRLWDPR